MTKTYIRTCQECSHKQECKPPTEYKSDSWKDKKCKKCKSSSQKGEKMRLNYRIRNQIEESFSKVPKPFGVGLRWIRRGKEIRFLVETWNPTNYEKVTLLDFPSDEEIDDLVIQFIHNELKISPTLYRASDAWK